MSKLISEIWVANTWCALDYFLYVSGGLKHLIIYHKYLSNTYILKIIIHKQEHAQTKIHQNSVYQIAISAVKQLINFSPLFSLAQNLLIVHIWLLRLKRVNLTRKFNWILSFKGEILSFQRDKIKWLRLLLRWHISNECL